MLIFFGTRASGGTADALASGASVRKGVGVQIPPRAPSVLSKGAPIAGAPFTVSKTGFAPYVCGVRAPESYAADSGVSLAAGQAVLVGEDDDLHPIS